MFKKSLKRKASGQKSCWSFMGIYCTTIQKLTREIPFTMAYGIEAITPENAPKPDFGAFFAEERPSTVDLVVL